MKGEDAAHLRKQVRALYRRMQRETPAVEGLPFTALQMLAAVERAPTPVRPSELAVELGVTTSNVAPVLRSLETQGMLNRRVDPVDGRKALVALTDLGKKVVADTRKSYYAWLQTAMEDQLTSEERRLLLQAGDLMQRLADHDPARDREPGGITADHGSDIGG